MKIECLILQILSMFVNEILAAQQNNFNIYSRLHGNTIPINILKNHIVSRIYIGKRRPPPVQEKSKYRKN